jgi:hypothetical protein
LRENGLMADRQYDRERLKNLFHYVIWKAGGQPNFGATKLYKTAWFADARRYRLTGRSITGARYIKQKYGPIPKDAMYVRKLLVEEGLVRETKIPNNKGETWKFTAMAAPLSGQFADDEKQSIDFWIKEIDEKHTAESISELSHDYGWQIADMNEELPFAAYLASRVRDPSEKEMAEIVTRAKERGFM